MRRADVFGCDLYGWCEIGAALGVHPETARKWARDFPACPVQRVNGRVRASTAALAKWVKSAGLAS